MRRNSVYNNWKISRSLVLDHQFCQHFGCFLTHSVVGIIDQGQCQCRDCWEKPLTCIRVDLENLEAGLQFYVPRRALHTSIYTPAVLNPKCVTWSDGFSRLILHASIFTETSLRHLWELQATKQQVQRFLLHEQTCPDVRTLRLLFDGQQWATTSHTCTCTEVSQQLTTTWMEAKEWLGLCTVGFQGSISRAHVDFAEPGFRTFSKHRFCITATGAL